MPIRIFFGKWNRIRKTQRFVNNGGVAQWQRVGFQTQRLGVQFPPPSFLSFTFFRENALCQLQITDSSLRMQINIFGFLSSRLLILLWGLPFNQSRCSLQLQSCDTQRVGSCIFHLADSVLLFLFCGSCLTASYFRDLPSAFRISTSTFWLMNSLFVSRFTFHGIFLISYVFLYSFSFFFFHIPLENYWIGRRETA